MAKLDNIVELRLDIDNKSRLQELAQEQLKITPNYELIGDRGPDHQKEFNMAVYIGDHQFGTGWGGNKQEGAQNAAGVALENWDELFKKYKDSFDK
jgi:ribonuclease-3